MHRTFTVNKFPRRYVDISQTSGKALEKIKKEASAAAKQHENVIVQKTFRMAETVKKYPLPRK
ncbi:hypothetical protein [Dyadobacter aurulentus]|uniref:hypothetical protein n=1 Tax=Dyadobacter sp. UC 10 TaxID=2605428 RepID=UPI0011F3B5F8|nr:hypothetical protein [Dyadobacter sp. UC 10]KAA0989190.1 hypothetical protein FXO21_02915 [Dyadobacter sp. UC 10]